MSQQTASRILRAAPGTRGTFSDTAIARPRRADPRQTVISALVFLAALFTLLYFTIVNWSDGNTVQTRVEAPALTEAEQTARDLDRAMAQAAQPAALDNFYDGNVSSADGPFSVYSGPVMAEDGSGPLPLTNGYGTPSIQLFQVEAGGWGVPFGDPSQEQAQAGLQ